LTGSTGTFQVIAPTVGGLFTAVTVSDTVAAAESTVPSFTLNVKLSAPTYPAADVYVTFGAVPVKVPCAGAATIE